MILASLFAVLYLTMVVGAILTLAQQPSFDRHTFAMSHAGQMTFISAKPSVAVWYEPEVYFPIQTERRIPVSLGYKVECIGSLL